MIDTPFKNKRSFLYGYHTTMAPESLRPDRFFYDLCYLFSYCCGRFIPPLKEAGVFSAVYDKMFKRNALDEAMDEAFENFKENNPVTRKAKKTIEDAGKGITKGLEKQLYGEVQDHPEGQPSVLNDFDTLSAEWDSMIDQIVDKELGKYKVCPNCCEAVPSELETCPHCNTPLPDITAAFQICSHCGAKNKMLDFKCVECGAPLELNPDAHKK